MLDVISFQIIKHTRANRNYSIKDILCYIEGALDYQFTTIQKIKLANQLIDMPSIFQLKIRVNDKLFYININQDKQKFSNKLICNLN